MTAINIPDMVQIVQEHGLIQVPLDIDPKNLRPFSVESFEKLITPKVSNGELMLFSDENIHLRLHLRRAV